MKVLGIVYGSLYGTFGFSSGWRVLEAVSGLGFRVLGFLGGLGFLGSRSQSFVITSPKAHTYMLVKLVISALEGARWENLDMSITRMGCK